MSTGLPSLYRRGTDIFGCRKTPPPPNSTHTTLPVALPPLPSVNDLLVFGRDEIAHMKDLKVSLKSITKGNNSSRAQRHHAPPPTAPNYNEDLPPEESESEEEDIEFEEEDEESDHTLSDYISMLGAESSDELYRLADYHENESNTESPQTEPSALENALLHQQIDSNIQIDEALSFVSNMICRGFTEQYSSSRSQSDSVRSATPRQENSQINSGRPRRLLNEPNPNRNSVSSIRALGYGTSQTRSARGQQRTGDATS